MRRLARGLTLAEMMVGTLVLFVAACALAAALASVSRYVQMERLRSQGQQLMAQKAHEIAVTYSTNIHFGQGASLSQILGGAPGSFNGVMAQEATGAFSALLRSNTYGASLNGPVQMVGTKSFMGGDWMHADLGYCIDPVMLVEDDAFVAYKSNTDTTNTFTRTLAFQTLQHSQALKDVAPNGTDVYFIGNPGPFSVFKCLQPGGPISGVLPPVARPLEGLVVQGTTLYVTDGAQLYSVDLTVPIPSLTPIAPPGPNFYPTGLVVDGTGATLWVVDGNYRCLYSYGLGVGGDWSGPFAPPDGQAPLLLPSQLACHSGGGSATYNGLPVSLDGLWVADQGNVCLRHFDPAAGQWDPQLYRPYTINQAAGSPRGVTTGKNGELYMVDASYLWELPPGGTWTPLVQLSPLMQYLVNSMRYDMGTQKIWFSMDDGTLWSWDAGSGFHYLGLTP